ncbi:MAG: DUF5317 family protein [Oscillospiraceae bacterium]|nr:DUF5317 family protein [Oscillospiraceae bacterium]MDD3832347.1 DUF5317 family protein [Oscillospiraceae bacterium]
MFFQVLLAIILAKYKGYRVTKALKRAPFYPFYVMEIIYVIFQVSIFLNCYYFVPYASILKSTTMYVLLIPIFVYKLYLPAIAGSGFIAVGTIMNKLVINANGGKMPVYPTLSKYTGYFTEEMIKHSSLHSLGGPDTKLKLLSDYIDVGYSVLSIGDLFIHMFIFIVFFYGIKAVTNTSN